MPSSERRFGLTHLGIISPIGRDHKSVCTRLMAGESGLTTEHLLRTTGQKVPVGKVPGEVPNLPSELARYDCRNHRLAYLALDQIRDPLEALKLRFGPERIAVVLGSSTAGLDATEAAYQQWLETGSLPEIYDFKRQHAMGSVAAVVADAAGLTGPAYTISTACTSSAKAMLSARDLLAAGFCDAVVTGGVDTLCHLTLNGFAALQALSPQRCLPSSVNRRGLNIGEGAALFLMTRDEGPINLIGGGESGDAHHMTAPHPDGLGAELAMREALDDAGLTPAEIAYLNLHGTATQQNDSMESKAVARVFGDLGVPCSSTKPLVGHTLGAAGAIEAAFCWLAFSQSREHRIALPPHLWDNQSDPDLAPLRFTSFGDVRDHRGTTHFMSNSFAFGGNNCSLILAFSGGES